MSWELGSFLVLGVALTLGLVWYERSRPPARVLALVAALAALAVVGRLAFAPFPNVKPTTDIVLLSGYALGGAPGFAVGSVAAIVSNIFLTHGPWTPWQMAAWGGVGLFGGALGWGVRRRRELDGAAPTRDERRELGRWSLAAACGVAGLGFGLVMDLYLWTFGGQHTLAAYLVLSGRSLPFNLAHAIGNVVFCLVIGPPLVRALRRYRQRFEVRWTLPEAASGRAGMVAVGAALSLTAVAASVVVPPPALADPTVAGAVRYLRGVQNPDGGFGDGRGDRSSFHRTTWAALGLAAGDYNPLDVERNGTSIIDYVRRHPPDRGDVAGLERTILVLRAADLNARNFFGRDFAGELMAARNGDGSFDGLVDLTAFGVLALRASSADRPMLDPSVDWLVAHQNADGGFGPQPGRSSDVDDTGAVLEAFAAAGRAAEEPARAAVAFLERSRDPSSGGFGLFPRTPANAQSTAYAVQGLVAAGGAESVVSRAVAYLRSLRAGDGSIQNERGVSATPVYTTAQAVAGLTREPYPLDPVPRRHRPRRDPAEEGRPRPDQGDNDGPPRPSPSEPRRADESKPPPASSGDGAGRGPGPGSAGGEGESGSGAAPGLSGESNGAAALSPQAGFDAPPLRPEPSSRRPSPLRTAADATENPAAAWRSLADVGPTPLARSAARDQLGAGEDKGGRGWLVAAILGTVAILVAAGTAAAARGRRLWAALARRRTP